MHPQQRHIPPRRSEPPVRRPRPAPLSPKPEWKNLFVEPDERAGAPVGEDPDDEPAPGESTRRPGDA